MDDVFADDIIVPAADRYPLGATLFLPRTGKRSHAVLINSATAVPRSLYRGFAGYLARRGCAVLTYDYRGTSDSRQKAVTGFNQPRSLVGFKASMSDWAAKDIASTVQWMRERYGNMPLTYVGHSFGGAVALKAASLLGSRAGRLVLFEPTLFYLLAQNGRDEAFHEAKALADHVRHFGALGDWPTASSRFADYWLGDGVWAAMPERRRTAFAAALPSAVYEFDAGLGESQYWLDSGSVFRK